MFFKMVIFEVPAAAVVGDNGCIWFRIPPVIYRFPVEDNSEFLNTFVRFRFVCASRFNGLVLAKVIDLG